MTMANIAGVVRAAPSLCVRVCVCVSVSVGGTAHKKAQTTKHSHTCKGGVQRKKHKLQNTVTYAKGSTVQKPKLLLVN